MIFLDIFRRRRPEPEATPEPIEEGAQIIAEAEEEAEGVWEPTLEEYLASMTPAEQLAYLRGRLKKEADKERSAIRKAQRQAARAANK